MTDRLTWPRRIAVAAFFLPEHAGTVLCVERNEARLHGEACAEAQTQRTVPVVFAENRPCCVWFVLPCANACHPERGDAEAERSDFLKLLPLEPFPLC